MCLKLNDELEIPYRKSQQQKRLSHTRIPKHEELEQVVTAKESLVCQKKRSPTRTVHEANAFKSLTYASRFDTYYSGFMAVCVLTENYWQQVLLNETPRSTRVSGVE